MNRILVAQTTRMGDVLQMSPLLAALRIRYPESHITFMVRDAGKAIADANPSIDEVLLYDEDDLYQDVISQDSDRLLHAYETVDELVTKLREANYDVVYNCTSATASAILFKLAGMKHVIGAHHGSEDQFVLRGAWANYFFTSVFHRKYNALNLCDIMRHFLDEPPPTSLQLIIPDDARTYARELLAQHGITPDDFIVCMQLGASEKGKRWEERRFAELGTLLADQHSAKILLLGVDSESYHGDAFAAHAPDIAVPLYGKTSIPQLAAVLELARFLVSNDTGTMHVAAAVDCPVILTSVGYVHFRETGPYGEGHCAIEQRRESLLRGARGVGPETDQAGQLEPAQVLQAINYQLLNANIQAVTPLPETDLMRNVEVYVSRFAPDGCLEWYPVLRRPIEHRDYLRIAYRAMWMDLMAKTDKRAEREGLETVIACYAGPPDALDGWHDEDATAFEQAAGLARRGIKTTEDLLGIMKKSGVTAKAKELASQLTTLNEELRIHGELHEPVRPLTLMAQFERDNLEGSDPIVLTRNTLQGYRDFYARARLLGKKLSLIRDLWKKNATER